jgi:ribosome-associated heat shock protein Hsp15
MEPLTDVRIDKWLWAVRLYKTRALATQACRGGHVSIDGAKVKPARAVRLNEIISARTGDILRTVKVTGLIENRVGPKLVASYLEDLTPAAEYLRVLQAKEAAAAVPQRPKGSGRPTKKDRRQLDALL